MSQILNVEIIIFEFPIEESALGVKGYNAGHVDAIAPLPHEKRFAGYFAKNVIAVEFHWNIYFSAKLLNFSVTAK